MFKSYNILLMMLVTVFSYGQGIKFQKNAGFTARNLNLVQKLTQNGDSLILESDNKKIRQVDILNEDYLESIVIDSTKGKIDLTKLSAGNYVVQARIDRHWIVMYLEKTENVINAPQDEVSNIEISEQKLFDGDKMYWVVYESNSQFSSLKTMALKRVDEIQELISKIGIELNNEQSKNNKMFVYEIYDKSKFLRNQLRNVKYYKSQESKFFNIKPVFRAEFREVDKSQT